MARTTETSIFRYHGHHRLFSFNPTSSVSLSFSRPLFSLSLSLSSVSSSSAALCCRSPRVSTAPVEYESQEGEFDFEGEIARLQSLRSAIGNAKSVEEKLAVVDGDSRVKRFFCSGKSGVSRVLGSVSCDSYELFLVKCLVAAGQEHVLSSGLGLLEGEFESERSALRSVFYGLVEMIEKWEVSGAEGLGKKNGVADEEIGALKKLLKTLREIEQFYDCIGGIIGVCLNWVKFILWEALQTGLVWSILTQAREFLYFKIYGKQCITPVAIMTSAAKNNHEHITSLCERHQWFGRGQSSFQLFEQPLVPAVSAEDGEWLVTKPFTPVCKPGGHGVIWKLAYDKGIFQWFYDHGRKGATVRQVSNVVAATDLTLLALAGIGLRHGKKMGFASCKRNLGATEGINVLIEKNLDGKWEYGLSCIEYTEFDKFGITDGLLSSNSLQAGFPANTNILYVDLPSAELVGSSNDEKSLPGMVLNIKKPIVYEDYFGFQHSVSGGRLECTMQNIADNFFNTYASRCYKGVEADVLDTFIVYNERRRVTSSAKKKRKHANKSLHQTPDGSLLDIMRNAYDLLSQCDIKMPEQCSGVLLHHNLQIEGNDRYADSGPPFLVLLHPALGPLWEVSRQKFYGGSISMGSELQVEVAEFLWRNVQLDGSMIVIAENVMGSTRIDENGEPMLQYGHRCGRCKLQNVKVQNKGINWNSGDNIYWKHDVQRFEALKIILHGNAEFEATDVLLQRNHVFEVPNGYKMKISSKNPGLAVDLNPIEEKMIDSGSWFWNYKISGTHIHLELVEF
ncbi:UTP--glucose-1-phosphate uridylyltransferase 3, chloroplastic isoform X5 [Vitis riparia]|uniref:UTP--glucose-1-phosphate uridylyltransferase 3, chloroplastic isoform X5 n=1 Tax=Vitis riparia TaxID=96939 RepID=UPI00155A13E6|nr:UTP--glucose-1-phosphate uridylyltransferase 3, chloroplastic isoform X5 [Vitis riparia]